MQKTLVTGVAGFIGFHLAKRLLSKGTKVVGIDNLNRYYDVCLKEDRLSQLQDHSGFQFVLEDISNSQVLNEVFCDHRPEVVINLAAQPGVRYSLANPHAYIESNIVGFANVLEGCHNTGVKHLVFASSSSVYGANTKLPFSVSHNVDHPISLYGASKKSNELMAHAYSYLFDLPVTGLRFFTVYGPWGRPDMSYFKFTRAIFEGQPIDVFNNGNMKRDFTYIDDAVEGILKAMSRIPEPDPSWSGDNPNPGTSSCPYKIYNVGAYKPVKLLHFVGILEACCGKKALMNMVPMQPGDLPETCADLTGLVRDTGFQPKVSLEEGLTRFVNWYKKRYLK